MKLTDVLVLVVIVGAIGFVLYWVLSGKASSGNKSTWVSTTSGIPGDFDFAAAAGTVGAQSGPNVVTRLYKGRLDVATAAFHADAQRMAANGYRVVSQTYTPGSYGCGAFLVALLLCIFLIGILIFIYMVLVKPTGTLMVTYQRD